MIKNAHAHTLECPENRKKKGGKHETRSRWSLNPSQCPREAQRQAKLNL